MKSSYMRGREGGGGISKVLGVACLLMYLDCGGVAGFRGSHFDYVSFEDTEDWNNAYRQTCRGRSHDDFREPRHIEFPDTLRPPYEAKTPISINTNETLRKNDSTSNFTLHIYSNPGQVQIYTLSYGFQRNKECIHGQDLNCIVQRSFGGIRALVLNAERFKPRQGINFIKDHFQVEDPEKHVSILNGGSPNERKFYEAVFLGGYIPKALQSRGKSSHVIDGKSYPMEIYMYFMDETVPSMSLTTILVVLVEESENDNLFVQPIVKAVNLELYDKERKFMYKNELLLRREHQFHNQDPSIKYDVFPNHKKKAEEQIRQEKFKASAKMNQDLADQFEIFEKMQALEAQLLLLDEDLRNAKAGYKKSGVIVENFDPVRARKTLDFPYDSDELYLLGYMSVYLGIIYHREIVYNLLHEQKVLSTLKNKTDLVTYAEWDDKDNDEDGVYRWFISVLHRELGLSYLFLKLSESTKFNETEQVRLINLHYDQLKNLSFRVINHVQKSMNWLQLNRDQSFMQSINNKVKYRLVKEYHNLLQERELVNEDVYNHFFGNDSLHQRAVHEWGLTDDDIIPDFQYTLPPIEERKRTVVDSIIVFVAEFFKFADYKTFILKTNDTIKDLSKANNFIDEETMRKVLHNLKFGYKDFGKTARRNYAHDAFFKKRLPYQQKRQGLVDLGNMEMSKNDNEEEANANFSSPTAMVNGTFQISWLIPPNGGYYYYSGSSPVPPCYRAHNVIVFKKPITMSRSQIKTLTRVPIAYNKNLDIVHTTPVLHDTKFRVKLATTTSEDIRYEEVSVPVYFQPRNHLFLGHDGVHKNAVEAYEARQRKRLAEALRGESAGLKGQSKTVWILVIGLAFVY